jgi:hypothetical protein
MRAIFVALMLALALPATAAAGGFSTVGLDSMPTGVGPGDTWRADFTVLGHGRTPMPDLRPVVILTGEGGERRTFKAQAGPAPGHYFANVTFPSAGRWEIAIREYKWMAPHTFGAAQIGGDDAEAVAAAPAARPPSAAPPGDDGPDVLLAALAALAAGALAGGATWLIQRRSSPGGEAATA